MLAHDFERLAMFDDAARSAAPGRLPPTPQFRRRRAAAARPVPPAPVPAPVIPGWVVDRMLGAGTQADVFAVRPVGDEPGRGAERHYVAKVYRRRGPDGTAWTAEEQQWRMLREVIALRLLESSGGCATPRVVTFGTCLAADCGADRPWYVMPHYEAGAMWRARAGGAGGEWAEPYRGNVDRVIEIAAVLATTLAAMHDRPRRVVHRDVTLANVLFAEVGGSPILADLGIALLDGFTDHPTVATWSTPGRWRPPELDSGDGYHLGPEGDVFMLGGLIYEALSGGRVLPPAADWDGGSVHRRPAHTLRQDSDDPRIVAVEALLERMLTRGLRQRLPAREVARVCRAIGELPRTATPVADVPAGTEGAE